MKVICIDASHRPNDIPTSKWLEKNKEYTVIKVDKMNMQNGIFGYKLAEIDLIGCAPYQYFAASRFRIVELKPDLELKKELEPELEESESELQFA